MKKIDQTEKFLNWNKPEVVFGSIACTWQAIDVPWIKVVQTEEVDKTDPWKIYTTDLKYQLAELHDSWSIPKESVTHYMSIRPDLNSGLEKSLESFKSFKYNYNLLKVTAGHMVVWHFDTYATFVKEWGIEQKDSDKIKRTVIALTPWSFGHVIQIGGDVLSSWKVGDTFTWNGDTWHGACNFGRDDLIIMQVTYIE